MSRGKEKIQKKRKFRRHSFKWIGFKGVKPYPFKKKAYKMSRGKEKIQKKRKFRRLSFKWIGFNSLLGKRRSSMEEESINITVAVEREAKRTN